MSNVSDFVNFDNGNVLGELVYINDTEKANVPQNGFLKCDGQVVSKSTYSNLYPIIGDYLQIVETSNSFSQQTAFSSRDIIYDGTRFVMVGDATIRYSTNGTTWTSRSPTGLSSKGFNKIIYVPTDSKYVMAGYNTSLSNSNIVIYPDITLTTGFTLVNSTTTSTINALTYGNGLYVYAGNGGVLATSTNAVTWTDRTSGTVSTINALAYGNGVYVYGGNGGVIATSTDGITWVNRTSGTTSAIRGLVYAKDRFICCGAGGTLRTSTDGITWSALTSGTTEQIEDIKYNDNIFVYHTTVKTVGFSFDGINWRNIQLTYPASSIATLIYNDRKIYYSNGTTSNSIVSTTFTYNPNTSFALPNTVRTVDTDEYLYIKY